MAPLPSSCPPGGMGFGPSATLIFTLGPISLWAPGFLGAPHGSGILHPALKVAKPAGRWIARLASGAGWP